MLEPAVTLTDYGLTLECWLLAALILRQPRTTMSRWWFAFFGFIGTASLLGGTVHGFLPDDTALLNQVLWDANMIAIGCTAVATWNLGTLLSKTPFVTRRLPPFALGLFITYVVTVVFVSNKFLVAIAMYLPATVFLTVMMSIVCIRDRQRGWEPGIVGLILTYVAAAVQQLKFALHPVYFDHNALYHAIQAIALFLMYRAQALVSRARMTSAS